MERLIPVINELQDVFTAIGRQPIDLPHIVVIGSQSSGKTSVLEALVGRDFLPRGIGLVTRRPLVLQLYNINDVTVQFSGTPPHGSSTAREKGLVQNEWAEFVHKPHKRYYDFLEVRAEIVAETERLTGKNKGISPDPITLKIFSPHVLNLTLVDLPGMTKVPTGDQPSDIEHQLRQMCLSYCDNPNAIILAVSASNTDITNSDAIQIAQAADPDGERTIGVLTKLDLMDSGTDAVDVLLGRVIHLKRGFVGVVNRGQRDIEEGRPIENAIAREKRFFETHPSYRHLADRMGVPYLATLLNAVLMSHIRAQLPALKSQVSQHIMNVRKELQGMGDPVDTLGNDSQGGTLLALISRFSSAFVAAIEGRGQENIRRDQLWGGARIQHIFQHSFQKTVERFHALDGLTMDDVRHAIRNATGPKSALFVPEGSFEALARRQVSLLEDPGLQCAQQVFAELLELTRLCIPPELQRFGDLKERVVETVHAMLRRLINPTKATVSNIIHIEKAYINTNHPDFVGGSEAVNRANELVVRHNAASDMVSVLDERDPLAKLVGDPDLQGYIDTWFRMSVEQLERQSSVRQHYDAARQKLLGQGSYATSPITDTKTVSSYDTPIWDRRNRPHASSDSASTVDARARRGFQDSPMKYMNGHTEYDAGSVQTDDDLSAAQRWQKAIAAFSDDGSRAGPDLNLPPPEERLDCLGKPVSHRELYEVFTIVTLLNSYFEIIRKSFVDLIPKIVMCYLVNQAKENIQSELVQALYTDGQYEHLLRESDDIARKRRQAEDALNCLNEALRIIDDVREFNVVLHSSAYNR